MGRFGRNGRAVAVLLLVCAWLPLAAPAAVAGSGSPASDGLERAVALVQQGRLDEADAEAQAALADPETRPIACSVLGTIRIRQQRLNEAVGLLKEAVRLEPRLLGAQLSLAQAYTLQNETDLALASFRKVLELDPGNPPARLAIARSEVENGKYEEALKLTEPVRPALTQTPEGLYVIAAALLKTGRQAEAARLAADWKRLPGVPPEAWIGFGTLLVQGGAVDAGIEVLDSAKEAGPPSYELAFNLAGAHMVRKDASRALAYYDAALSLKPESLDALRLAAPLAERNGELERSLSYWLRAKKLAPEDPQILLGFGRVCLKMDLLDDAEPALEKAAAMKPGEIPYEYTLAAVKFGKRQNDEARALLQPLAEAHPEDPHLRYAIGTVLYTQGRLDEAAGHLKESIRLNPDQLASYYYLALVVRDQGNDADATALLEKLLLRHPDHAAANEVLGGLLMRAQGYEEAERHLRKAVALDPQSVRANYQLGLLLARTGKKEEADRQLAYAKALREQDEKSSRMQLRLMDPD